MLIAGSEPGRVSTRANIGAPHPCPHPGCGTRTPHGQRYCDRHAAERRREDDQRRGSADERGYTARWKRRRKAYLAAHPLCAECQRQGRITPANVVDHIIPHRGDPKLFWDPANLQALCDYRSPWDCHNAKTSRERRPARGPRTPAPTPDGVNPPTPIEVGASPHPPGGGRIPGGTAFATDALVPRARVQVSTIGGSPHETDPAGPTTPTDTDHG